MGQELGGSDGGGQGGGDLGLQAGLFVQADLDAGQEQEFGSGLRVLGEPGSVVVGERLLEVVLAVGGRAGAEGGAEGGDSLVVGGLGVGELGQEAGELVGDFGEDLEVASCSGLAGCFEAGEGGDGVVDQAFGDLVGECSA
ncbi:hypothetical protein [Actinokineospora spheciospongiae]|uniref:hypothetical protein n=1 Tax=Actinokineospora spheciospongiae TaxID=909613 RepID=UPI0011B5E39F|nr:hypothetical protein [Actinokineospora spheciospongiae]